MNPGRDSATNQIRRKEPQIPTTTNYNRVGTKYNEAKTNRSPTGGSEFSGKGDISNTSLDRSMSCVEQKCRKTGNHKLTLMLETVPGLARSAW